MIYFFTHEKHYVHLEYTNDMDFADRNDFCRIWWSSLLIRGAENVLDILNISVASIWIFLTCIETAPSISKKFSKDALKSLYIIRKTLSCKRLILLSIEGLQNIQTRREQLDFELKNEFIRMCPLLMFINGVILDNALILQLAFFNYTM